MIREAHGTDREKHKAGTSEQPFLCLGRESHAALFLQWICDCVARAEAADSARLHTPALSSTSDVVSCMTEACDNKQVDAHRFTLHTD
jgi:hypothetical protein